jgi:very-short-patch-repair endonuclease
MGAAVTRDREIVVMPRRTVSPLMRASAKRLRRSMTGAETRLWEVLRGHRFIGVAFRRQTPVGPYIADFFCAAARLIIEVDGGQHGEGPHVARDRGRDVWLADAGYRVLRFWNHEVLAEMDAVLDVIHGALVSAGVLSGDAEPPLPVPPPPGGRERNRQAGAFPTESASDVCSETPAMRVPSPLEGEGQGEGGSVSPLATTPLSPAVSSAPNTGRRP